MKTGVIYMQIFPSNYSAYTADTLRADCTSMVYIKHGFEQMHIKLLHSSKLLSCLFFSILVISHGVP